MQPRGHREDGEDGRLEQDARRRQGPHRVQEEEEEDFGGGEGKEGETEKLMATAAS